MSDSDERELVERAQRGETAAFGELVRAHQTSVFNVCLRLMGERAEAEDAAQEAFIRAFGRLSTFQPERPFGPWMRRVAANLCLNQLDARREAVPLDEERDEAAELTPEASRMQTEQSQAVRTALISLPAHYRAVVELRHFQELSYDEIAAELNLPLSDVKSHLFRARKLLAEKLQRET